MVFLSVLLILVVISIVFALSPHYEKLGAKILKYVQGDKSKNYTNGGKKK